MAPEFISLQDASALVGVNVKTIRRWIAAGRLTGYRLGPTLIRVDRAELVALARPIPAGAAVTVVTASVLT